jgi:hypothetical protein
MFSLDPVDPLDFLFADCLKRGHGGLKVVSVVREGQSMIAQLSTLKEFFRLSLRQRSEL